jgi:hypothetical protein
MSSVRIEKLENGMIEDYVGTDEIFCQLFWKKT